MIVSVDVPAGVPELPAPLLPPFLLPPPHPMNPKKSSRVSANAKRIRRLRMVATNAALAKINPSSDHQLAQMRKLPKGTTKIGPSTLARAAVVTETVAVTAAVPLGVTVAGFTVQLAAVGAPVHVRLTAELNPLLGVTVSVYVAGLPALTVAEFGFADSEKSPLLPFTICVNNGDVLAEKLVSPR